MNNLFSDLQQLTTAKLTSQKIERLLPYVEEQGDFLSETNHYRLLSYISWFFNDVTLIDIGTNKGSSAIALSANPRNKVITFDIESKRNNKVNPPNIEWIIGDILTPGSRANDEFWPIMMQSPFIFCDVDPHDGIKEAKFFYMLSIANYGGNVLWDDINLNNEMRKFWTSIQQPKLDLTSFGHYSGTGFIGRGPLPPVVLPQYKVIATQLPTGSIPTP